MLNFKWTSARVGVPLAQVRESAITSSRHVLQQWEIKNGKSEVSSITFIGWALFSTCGNLVVTRASNPLVASLPTILDLVLRWMNIIILPQSRISSSSAEILYSGGFSSSTRTPGIVKGNNPLSLVWFKWGSQWWGILKHFPQSRCILISHWSREKKQSSFII